MTLDEIRAHFGSLRAAGRELGLTRLGSNWGKAARGAPDIPLVWQYRLERLTEGKLRVEDPVLDRLKGRGE